MVVLKYKIVITLQPYGITLATTLINNWGGRTEVD